MGIQGLILFLESIFALKLMHIPLNILDSDKGPLFGDCIWQESNIRSQAGSQLG